MSNLSQFLGGGVPIGATMHIPNAPLNFTAQGAEYLRNGNIKTYNSSYAYSYTVNPALGVFGTVGYIPSGLGSTSAVRVYYISGRYIAISRSSGQGSPTQATTLAGLASGTVITGGSSAATADKTNCVGQGNGYLIVHNGAANALLYTTNGTSFTVVGGTWTVNDVRSTVCYTGAGWIAVGPNTNNANYGYITSTNPTGAWTITAAGNITAQPVGAIWGNSIGVVTTANVAGNTNKLLTFTVAGGAFTDRTANLQGIVTTDVLTGITFANGYFYTCTEGANSPKAWRSTNGINWISAQYPFDVKNVDVNGVAISIGGVRDLCQDATGKMYAFGIGTLNTISISSDGGATWTQKQYNTSQTLLNITTTGGSIANGDLIISGLTPSSSALSVMSLGASTLTTPDYIGQQFQSYYGQFTRIK